uniref:Uncharacterized protein n=1 Tax=Anguilla anguilla TaxID=7936 RepID=A0A0E9XFH1_ANGAN
MMAKRSTCLKFPSSRRKQVKKESCQPALASLELPLISSLICIADVYNLH